MGQYLQECKIALPPGDTEVLDAFRKNIQRGVEDAGGELFEWSEAYSSSYTHVVVNHMGERHAATAKELEQQTVSLLWLLECVQSARLLPVGEEVLYNAQFPLSLPGAADVVVATTGYQGIQKVVYGRMMQTMGLDYHKAMNPKLTNIVISTDVTDRSSAKVGAAHQHKIPVVSVLWLYDCLRQGTILPADGYTSNPPAQMDPFKGALAMDASLQVVANSGTSDGGSHDSQPETASRAAPAPAPPPAARTQEELQQLAAEDEQAGKDMIMTKFEEGLREGEGERGPDVDASLPESGSRGGGDGNPGVALMEKTPLGESRITHTPGAIAPDTSIPQPRGSGGFVPPRPAADSMATHKTPLAQAAASAVVLAAAAVSGSRAGWRPAEAASKSSSPRTGTTTIQAPPKSQEPGNAASVRFTDQKGGLVRAASPEILGAGEVLPADVTGEGSRADSYADISQQVRAADDLVGLLVGNDKPGEGDETDDDLDPRDAHANRPSDKEAPGDLHIEGPSKVASAGGLTRPSGKVEGKRMESRIPVNASAPLASQEYRGVDGSDGEDEGEPPLASQNGGRAASGAVLWKAPPVGRSKRAGDALPKPGRASGRGRMSNLGRGTKRKPDEAGLDPLIGRTVRKKIQQQVFKGTVQSFNQEKEYYRVVYEDNDSEEMSASELHLLFDAPPAAPGGEGEVDTAQSPGRALAHAPPKMVPQQGPQPDVEVRKAGRKGSVPIKDPASESTHAASKKGRAAQGIKRASAQQAFENPGTLVRYKSCDSKQPEFEVAAQEKANEAFSGDENDSPARNTTPAGPANQSLPESAKLPRKITPKRSTPASAARQVDKRPVFTVSGMHSDARERVAATLRSLAAGSSIDLACHQWNSRCTHVLVPSSWIRGAKVLAAMASGAWLLSDQYLTGCSKAHRLLEEDDYEVEGNRKNTVSKASPKHWRLRKKLTGKGAFHGLKAVVHGELGEKVRPRRDEVVSILQAGGANVITLNQALTVGAHFCVTKPDRPASDPKLKQLLGAGLCVVSPPFVVEWVAHPWKLPAKFVVYKSKMGVELAAAASNRGELDSGGSLVQPGNARVQGMKALVTRPPLGTEIDEESQLY